MADSALVEIREELRRAALSEHDAESVPFGCVTSRDVLAQADDFAELLVEHVGEMAKHTNERGFAAVFAAIERVHRALEAASAAAFNAVDERRLYRTDGHRTAQAFLQASVNVSDRERNDRLHIARLVKLCPQVAGLLAEGTLPVGHAVALGLLVANERLDPDRLLAALSGFLLYGSLLPHDAFAKRVREWGRLNDPDGSRPDADASHRNRNVRLTNVLDAFILEGRFGNVQGVKMAAILNKFIDIESDRDWQEARAIHGDETCMRHLRRNSAQRRADALEAIFLAAIGEGDAANIDIIINIVTDAETFTETAGEAADAAAAPAEAAVADTVPDTESPGADVSDADVPHADETPDSDAPDTDVSATDPAPAPFRMRRFCHTLDGVEIDPRAAVRAAIDGHIRAVVVDGRGVIIDQGRKQRLFRGNARVAAQIQAGLDNLHRCSWPACRARPRHIDHGIEWASADAGRTDLVNSNLPCNHHNLWKHRHGYTVRRDGDGILRTYRPDGTELLPY
jgi:hypothetical protein